MMTNSERKVLLVDDNPTTVEVFSKLLVSAGYRCTQVRGGAAAYRTFCEQSPDLIVTDLNMAGGDGYVLIDRVREISSVPILVVTGLNTAYARQKLDGQYSGLSFLTKPCDRKEFLDAVGDLMEQAPLGAAMQEAAVA